MWEHSNFNFIFKNYFYGREENRREENRREEQEEDRQRERGEKKKFVQCECCLL